MRKKNITRKLIMSISTAAMTAICLGTSTYAWFSRNDNVWIEETDLYVSSYDGLLISLDGKNFSQDIKADDLKKVITGKSDAEEARNAYSSLNLIGTTMKQDENSTSIVRDTDSSIMFTHDRIDHKDDEYINYVTLINQSNNNVVAKVEFTTSDNLVTSYKASDKNGNELDIEMVSDTEYDIKSGNDLVASISNLEVISYVRDNLAAKDSNNESLKYIINYVDNGYSHNDEKSIANDNYLKFDLHFRIASDNGAAELHPEYNLSFTDKTFLKSKETSKVKLNNKLTAYDPNDIGNPYKDYNAGDEIKFDVANAMRIAVDSDDSLNIFEVENVTEIINEDTGEVEGYIKDLGSAAIEGSTDSKHNKNKNAMYTYFNNLFPNYPFESAAINGDRFNTKSEYTGVDLATFTYDETKKQYNDVKTTVYIWLEGWDADYFLGTSTNSRNMSVMLEFKYKDKLND